MCPGVDEPGQAAEPEEAASPTTASTENVSCLVFCELFSTSVPGEMWVQCVYCYKWSHEACTKGCVLCVCHLCEYE